MGEDEKMIEQANQQSRNVEKEGSKDLDGLAKALIVSFAWSWGEIYEENKRSQEQERSVSETPKPNSDRQINE